MPNYRRNFRPGATYFFTAVTEGRRPILTTELGRRCLREAFISVRAKRHFDLVAIVLLPDHVHTIWTMPVRDTEYSLRWSQIKERFTRSFLDSGGSEGFRTDSRTLHRERAIWQRRFWEHTCRDEDDLKRCVDYLHWNPVKHEMVRAVKDYPWSTFFRFVKAGEYDLDWGGSNPCPGLVGEGWE
jgi:putative transposase